jgi:hypothetical protein
MERQSGDERVADERASELRGLERNEFRRRIKRLDDDTLADLRYELGWDPGDPRKSSSQAIDINRLLTRRKARRQALPQWIGIAISGLIGLAGLIVA